MSGPRKTSSVWVPRAVRQVERSAAAASSAAAAHTASGAPSSSAWHADDLDDLDAPDAKRAKTDAADAAPAAEQPAVKAEQHESLDEQKASIESLEDEVISGAARLAEHIKSAQKCIRVAAMAFSLLEQGAVTARSSGPFFLVIAAAMADPMRPIADAKYRVCYRKLFEGVLRRKHAFSAEQQQQIEVWHFQLLTSLELIQADESFAFMRAARKVLDRLESLKPDAMPPGKMAADYASPQAAAMWTPALMVSLATALMHYGKSSWAKPAVEGMVKAAMATRKQWAEPDARRIEEWNRVCKDGSQQRRVHGGPSSFVTSFDTDAARWKSAEISVAKKREGSRD